MERIEAGSGVVLQVEACRGATCLEITLEQLAGPPCLLHWGLSRAVKASWSVPPRAVWPAGSELIAGGVRTPFVFMDGRRKVGLCLDRATRARFLEFALVDPKTSRWDNQGGANYRLTLPTIERTGPTPREAARGSFPPDSPVWERVYQLDDGYELAVAVVRKPDQSGLMALATDLPSPIYLHWGIGGKSRRSAWAVPSESMRPPGTRSIDVHAVQTPFVARDGLRQLEIPLRSEEPVAALCFVLVDSEQKAWWKDRGHDFYLPLQTERKDDLLPTALEDIAEQILDRETAWQSWSLMHRFELANELLGRISPDDRRGLALLFVWLRFSEIRQLDWQRNFNTKPRELAHAQDRLTRRIGERYGMTGAARPMIRMIAKTLGKGGGEGQRVRDGILEIMHRHHIKEVAGHFLEEWHQKLHNNTTPDDVVICEAYLEFLRRFGDRAAFYATLEAGGVSRDRLKSYERPIKSDPDFVPHLREGLLHDFGEFLLVLRAVHAATDLGVAIKGAWHALDDRARQLLDALWHRRDDASMQSWVLETITALRGGVATRIEAQRLDPRDLLYLDLALEDFLRTVIERNLQNTLSPDDLLSWTESVLKNLHMSRPTEELSLGLRHMQRLMTLPRFGREWVLHTRAVVERLRAEITASIDSDGRLLQPIAEYLGAAVGAADWSIRLFSEEVLRGGLDFAASALLRKLDDRLRAIAGLGHWQVVSRGRGEAVGVVQSLKSLAAVQGQRFPAHTVLIVDEVRGEEDLPEGTRAVLSESSVDLLSHVAVRARNEGVLMATCSDTNLLSELHGRRGEWIHLQVDASGNVIAERAERAQPQLHPAGPSGRRVLPTTLARPTVVSVPPADFDAERVGSKSRNLQRLRSSLPGSIDVPRSLAIPFGVCERVLDDPCNEREAREIRRLIEELPRMPDTDETVGGLLSRIRCAIEQLTAPGYVEPALRAGMQEVGLPFVDSWPDVWKCITRVWASKWNERAYFSRRMNGIDHSSLVMAVLIQEVVPPEYAFVVHTADPTTGSRDTLYGEIVAGLGETLVGNHPGRALGFTVRRGEARPHIVSFPSKSIGLFGGRLIFRSDSNGEDLAEFAGAGLYDSVVLPAPRPVTLDYTTDGLLWDEARRDRVLGELAEVGRLVEAQLGGPQDIEGVYGRGRFCIVQARPQVGVAYE